MQRITPSTSWPLHQIAATRQIEQAVAATLPAHTLMERAGLAVARLALALAPHGRTVWIACGPGNNGGDGLEAAMHLRQWGGNPVVTWLGDPKRAPTDARVSLDRALAVGVVFSDSPPVGLDADDLIVDALLGIGATRAPGGRMADWIRQINDGKVPVLAVDVPSGLDCDTGQPVGGAQSNALESNAVVKARHTLTLLTCKPGLFTAYGRDFAGAVWFDDLGVRPRIEDASAMINIAADSSHRPHASHKGSLGDVAVIGGEGLAHRGMGMTGAALLAGRAALYGGAGRVLVSLLDNETAMPDPTSAELMFRQFEALDLSSVSVVCGCGGGDAIRACLPAVLSRSPRLVLDADGLNAIAVDPSLKQLLQRRSAGGLATVLTPHPLEAARLLGCTSTEVMADRLSAARSLSMEYQAVVVLKGSGTIVASPEQLARINLTGNGLLATAGTGDVLAGLIGARLANGWHAMGAACAAVYQHGAAADTWPVDLALTAGRLAESLTP